MQMSWLVTMQMSWLLTMQMSWLLTMQMSWLQTQQMSWLQTSMRLAKTMVANTVADGPKVEGLVPNSILYHLCEGNH